MNEKYLVAKANDLVEARYKLDTQEQKLVLAVVSMIKPEDKDFHEYRLTVKEFMELIGVAGNGYHTLVRQRAKTFMKKPLVILQDNGDELICNWFSSIKYLQKEAQMVMSFDPALKPYLLNLQSKFTFYQLRNVVKLKSGYSIRIYELLRQYLRKGERFLTLNKLRLTLGIEPKQYSRFNDFKRRVLDIATQEIPKKTDITFTWKPKKTGRKITGILFRISSAQKTGKPSKQKPQHQNLNLLPPKETDTLPEIPVELLDMIALVDRAKCMNLCRKIFAVDGADGLRFYLEKTNNRKKNGISSYSGYLKTVFGLNLYADYLASRQAQKEHERVEQAKIQEQLRKEQEGDVRHREQLTRQEALKQLEQDQPEKYQKLYDQAVCDLGINSGRFKRGDNLKIIFKMTDIINHQ